MAGETTLLSVLLRERHWQKYATFRAEYDKAARSIDPALIGTWPSRAQMHRWLSGTLKGLPYPDHCRVLEEMFPGWSAEQLCDPCPGGKATTQSPTVGSPTRYRADSADIADGEQIQLVTSGSELAHTLLDVVRGAQECFVAVGSRSREPAYLQEIERTLQDRPNLVHYRILIGPPHSQVFKDHLLRLLEIRGPQHQHNGYETLYISILDDLTHNHERFFVANEQAAVVTLPSANSPANFDTGLVIRNLRYVQGLLQHGKALYGKYKLETAEAINELEVLHLHGLAQYH